MRAVIQRVHQASVTVDTKCVGTIQKGLLLYLGIGKEDNKIEAKRFIEKIIHLRLFSNQEGKFDHSLLEVQGELLIVSQFTLYGNAWKGRRPEFTAAACPKQAEELYEFFIEQANHLTGNKVQRGIFGAHMDVSSVNDGPVTLWLESKS